MRYANKCVIITGGAKGIGAACVKACSDAGAKVAVIDRDAEAGHNLGTEVGGGVRFYAVDVTEERKFRETLQAIVIGFGRLDGLINNVGAHPPSQRIDDTTADSFRRLLELNLLSTFIACQVTLPFLRRTQGAIVNIASLVGHVGQHEAAPYAATKGAILALTKSLAMDEAPHGVRINSISPGNIHTPLFDACAATTPDPSASFAEARGAQWIRRLGKAEEVAKAALYLIAEATYTTGADLLVTGGAELGYGAKPEGL